jgi:hypothetical protein
VIRTRTTSVGRLPACTGSGLAVANPSCTRSTSRSVVKPCASMVASVAPFGAAASNRSARRWSAAKSRPSEAAQMIIRSSGDASSTADRTTIACFAITGRCSRQTIASLMRKWSSPVGSWIALFFREGRAQGSPCYPAFDVPIRFRSSRSEYLELSRKYPTGFVVVDLYPARWASGWCTT